VSVIGSSGLATGDTARDRAFAERILFWVRVIAATVCAPAFLVGGIGHAVHAPEPLYMTGMWVFSTGMTGGGLAALLTCWRPARWVPGLREMSNRCCLFGSIFAVIFLGMGLASSPIVGGGRVTPLVGLAFAPATLMGLGGLTLIYVTYRLHPDAGATNFQQMKYYKRRAAELQAEQEERARLNPYPTELEDWKRNGEGR
jgi:hypothetical protein